MNTIINNINKLCEQHNMSQRQLALRSNVAISTLNDNMNGRSKFSEKTLNKIAHTFNTTIATLHKNIELDNYFSKSQLIPMSKLHMLKNNFLFFADKHDTIPEHLNLEYPLLISAYPEYNSFDLVLSFNDSGYIIDTYANNNRNIVGKVIGYINPF